MGGIGNECGIVDEEYRGEGMGWRLRCVIGMEFDHVYTYEGHHDKIVLD
jgi:hypothetical protein